MAVTSITIGTAAGVNYTVVSTFACVKDLPLIEWNPKPAPPFPPLN